MKINGKLLQVSILLFIVTFSSLVAQRSTHLMKGIAYRQLEPKGEECSDLEQLNVSWYYNWTPAPNCPGDNDLEFIPMIWSQKYLVGESYEKYFTPLIGSNYSALLGYNEPNWLGQAEMTVEEALEYWPMLEKTGLRLGGPSTTGRSGLDWSIEFMKGAKERGYRIDFLALHWYGNCSDTKDLASFLDYYDSFNMPMWLTEWSCYKQDMPTNTHFLKEIIPVLLSYERLERYAWYSNRTTHETYLGAALFDSTGNPTSNGEIYMQLPGEHQKTYRTPVIPELELEIIDWNEGPVIGKGDADTKGIKHGFEGGRVIKQDGWYNLFTSEQLTDPKWVKMQLGHWKSKEGIKWDRRGMR